MRSLAAALALLVLAGPAQADGPAFEAYAAGEFATAAELAQSHDPALAARALIAEAVTGAGDVDALIARAERHARAAVAADAGDVEARLQLALALGLKGRRAPVAEAIAHGYAREGRVQIDTALRLAPDNAWVHALDGAWHLEILRRGGAAGAALYGARRSAGIAAFERARALGPDDPVIAFQYAVALLDLDGVSAAPRARALLADAAACRGRDAFETEIAAAARHAARVLAEEGAAAAVRVAAGRMG